MERDTAQRRAIREVLEQADRPLSPREVLEEAQNTVAGLGMATVYRNIKALVRDRWLQPVELPGEPPRYELTGKHHHHHFRCRSCHRVFELNGCPGNLTGLVPPGFRLEDHDLLLFGRCHDCAA